jgi:hypothetical protein
MDGPQRVQTLVGTQIHEHALGKGDALCIAPGVAHRSDNVSVGLNLSRWSHLNIAVLDGVDSASLYEIPTVFSGEAAQRLGDLNEQLAHLHSLPSPEFPHILQRQALGFELGALILERSALSAHGRALLQHAARLAPALSHINRHLEQPISRDELACCVHLSPSRFAALFKSALGLAPGDYVQNLRLQRAQRLLRRVSLQPHL